MKIFLLIFFFIIPLKSFSGDSKTKIINYKKDYVELNTLYLESLIKIKKLTKLNNELTEEKKSLQLEVNDLEQMLNESDKSLDNCLIKTESSKALKPNN